MRISDSTSNTNRVNFHRVYVRNRLAVVGIFPFGIGNKPLVRTSSECGYPRVSMRTLNNMTSYTFTDNTRRKCGCRNEKSNGERSTLISFPSHFVDDFAKGASPCHRE
jgi:hypothetical protein